MGDPIASRSARQREWRRPESLSNPNPNLQSQFNRQPVVPIRSIPSGLTQQRQSTTRTSQSIPQQPRPQRQSQGRRADPVTLREREQMAGLEDILHDLEFTMGVTAQLLDAQHDLQSLEYSRPVTSPGRIPPVLKPALYGRPDGEGGIFYENARGRPVYLKRSVRKRFLAGETEVPGCLTGCTAQTLIPPSEYHSNRRPSMAQDRTITRSSPAADSARERRPLNIQDQPITPPLEPTSASRPPRAAAVPVRRMEY
jgi:hypothetical protein